MRTSSRPYPFVLTALVLSLAVGALADVDVTVGNADKIQGTIESADATDVFRLQCPAGATLSVKAKGKKGFVPDVVVVAPGQEQVAAGKGGVSFSEGPLESTGEYLVRITGAGGSDGDYSLSASFRLPKKTVQTVTLGEGETAVPFTAIAGTVLKVKVKASKSSAAVPRILRLDGPDELAPPAKTASASLGKTELEKDGDYAVVLDDEGGSGGDVEVTIQLKQPKTARRKLDFSAGKLRSSAGERFAISNVVGTDGGVVAIPPPGESDLSIAGAGVVIPAGALPSPTPVVVGTASDVIPRGDDGGAGPSLFCGPEGLMFEELVMVTIPFDVAQFGDDLSSLLVYTRDARGKVTLVPGPYSIDAEAGTCTFPVSHFSSFRVARQDALVGIRDIVGVWRLSGIPKSAGGSFIVLSSGGVIEQYNAAFGEPCTYQRSEIDPGNDGVTLADLFEVRKGKLVFLPVPSITYDPAQASDLPNRADCEDISDQ